MDIELGFRVGDRYSIALLVFFITYFIFEIPSNVVLRKVGAANWLAFLCISWGLVTFGAGFAKKWTDIVVCRLLLGLFEAVSLTLITFLSPTNGSRDSSQDQCKLNAASYSDPQSKQGRYLISCWYTRFEVQKRLAAFYSINVMANGFGSILAYGCMQLSGRNGWLGWRWFVLFPRH